MSASASRRRAAFTWWPSTRRPFTTTVPRPSRCARSSASITSSGGGEVVRLGREGVVAVGQLERMHQALAVEAQVAREAAGVLEGLHVLQVRGDAVDDGAVVGAAREQHVREAVQERHAIGRAPAVQLVQQVARSRSRGRRCDRRPTAISSARSTPSGLSIITMIGRWLPPARVEERERLVHVRASTRRWGRAPRRRRCRPPPSRLRAPRRVEVVHAHHDFAPPVAAREHRLAPRCGATRPSSRPGSGRPRSRITESTLQRARLVQVARAAARDVEHRAAGAVVGIHASSA